MNVAKLGALTALGTLLALPALAQTSYQGMSQNRNGVYDQSMNGQTGASGWPGMNGSSFNGNEGSGFSRQNSLYEGGGYGPNGTNSGNNSGNNQYGQNQYGQNQYGQNGYGQFGNGNQYGNGHGNQYGDGNGSQYGNGNQYGNGSQFGQNSGMHGTWSNRRMVGHEVFALRQALGRAGFSHIHVLPESFLVRAMDQQGHHVLMLVSPNSIEEMMAFNPGHMGQQGMSQQGMGQQGMMGRSGMNSGNYGNMASTDGQNEAMQGR